MPGVARLRVGWLLRRRRCISAGVAFCAGLVGYRAADLAWWAASLMPNDSADTARILMEAGGWLKDRDPRAAERFYQAMAIRCGNTSLGRAAAQIHWFPVSAGENTPAIRSAPP